MPFAALSTNATSTDYDAPVSITHFRGPFPERVKLPLGRQLIAASFALVAGAPVIASRAEAPKAQPIAFSHRVHAQDHAIPCLYCHPYARRGPVAGLPSVQRCVGCHTTIANERPEVLKLMGYWDRAEPIAWERVHDLPDFVRFNHKRHVLAQVDCRECHGDVQSMEAAQQVNSLEMGFCLECHRRRGASTDCLTCHY